MTTQTVTSAIWFIDNLVRVHLSGDETDERLSLIEMLAPRGHMPPLHVHRAEDETFYVLEGHVRLYVGDAVYALSQGEAAFAPREIPHTFRVESETARVLVAATPAGLNRFVAAAGRPADALELPAETVLPDPQRFAEICEKFEIELLGPPGTLPS